MNEALNRLLSPGLEGALAKAAGKALDAGKADPLNLSGVAIEHDDSAVGKDVPKLLLFAGFVFMVPKHGEDGDLHHNCGEFFRKETRFFRQTIVDNISTKQKDVCTLSDVSKQRLRSPLRSFRVMDISYRR